MLHIVSQRGGNLRDLTDEFPRRKQLLFPCDFELAQGSLRQSGPGHEGKKRGGNPVLCGYSARESEFLLTPDSNNSSP